VGCTVAPGFEFEDFEMGKRGELVELYPHYRELIERLTRG
jgi:predicted cupin superfamily sugar epimerase